MSAERNRRAHNIPPSQTDRCNPISVSTRARAGRWDGCAFSTYPERPDSPPCCMHGAPYDTAVERLGVGMARCADSWTVAVAVARAGGRGNHREPRSRIVVTDHFPFVPRELIHVQNFRLATSRRVLQIGLHRKEGGGGGGGGGIVREEGRRAGE